MDICLDDLGGENNHIHLVKKGKLHVLRDQETIGTIDKYQFVGEMSFLTWEGNIGAQINARRLRQEDFRLWNVNALGTHHLNDLKCFECYLRYSNRFVR